ncbi:hypothetical protein ACU8KH_01231 [Lachancea thermotolerans]
MPNSGHLEEAEVGLIAQQGKSSLLKYPACNKESYSETWM